MVNNLGQWAEEKDYSTYPKGKWCDMDYVADYIRKQNYEPQNTIEHLISMVLAHFEYDTEYFPHYNDNSMINIDNLSEFVKENGGLKEFDYFG